MSENAFRSLYTGKLSPDVATNMAINTTIRMRNDLTFRLKYVPYATRFADIFSAREMAVKAANDANLQQKLNRCYDG